MNHPRRARTSCAVIAAVILTTTWCRDRPGSQGMMDGGMREMMHQMMGGVVPSGTHPKDLPEPGSRGARVLATYCAQCHALPSPAMHTADDWPAIVARMVSRMRMMTGMGRGMMMMMRQIRVPTAQEESELVSYLSRHAMRPASPDAIAESDLPGAFTFARTCAQCHALPDPTQHAPEDWPSVVERMRRNQREMGKPVMTEREKAEIVEFLQRSARPARGG